MTDPASLRDIDGFYARDIADLIASADPEKKNLLSKIAKMTVEHRRFVEAKDWLDEHLLESGIGREATCGLIYGPPGVGKSTILRRFAKKFGGPFETREGTRRPVLRVITPGDPNLGNLYSAILRALDADELANGRNPEKKTAVQTQLGIQNVKLLIFDEFTHTVEDRTEKFTKKPLREIKELLSENHCQCVFAGTEELVKLHELYEQFHRRSGGDYHFTTFDWTDGGDRGEWEEILEGISDELPIKPMLALNRQQRPHQLHFVTGGIMDNLMKFLLRATALAYDEGQEFLSEDHLWHAFERMRRGDKQKKNPFQQPKSRPAKPRVIQDEDEDDELSGLWSIGSERKAPPEKFNK
jgi:hypothetical protein